MYSVGFLTLGCKVNAYETNAMEKLFLEAGFEVREFSEPADAYVINTCTVTNIADRKSRQMLHKAKKRNPDAVLAAVGCYVQASREEVEKEEVIDLIIGNSRKSQIVELVTKCLDDRKAHKKSVKRVSFTEMEERLTYEEMPVADAGDKNRAYIKIQDGCNQFCAYCIIPYVRGRVRSRKESDILQEIEGLTAKGYREVVLTGIHLSSYGAERGGEAGDFVAMEGKPLLELVRKLETMEGLERIRLGSLEPRIMTEAFISGLSGCPKICPHFHLSLQSGCDSVLKRMNRKYTTRDYAESVELLRKYFNRPAITTDLIVGFPGESPEEFSETESFMEHIGFSDVHIFKYSRRKGTKADRMEGQVPESVKSERSRRLIELGRKSEAEYIRSLPGAEETLLLEEIQEIGGRKYWMGRISRYSKAAVLSEGEEMRENDIFPICLGDVLQDGVLLASKK